VHAAKKLILPRDGRIFSSVAELFFPSKQLLAIPSSELGEVYSISYVWSST
jgi:hypothetical protein